MIKTSGQLERNIFVTETGIIILYFICAFRLQKTHQPLSTQMLWKSNSNIQLKNIENKNPKTLWAKYILGRENYTLQFRIILELVNIEFTDITRIIELPCQQNSFDEIKARRTNLDHTCFFCDYFKNCKINLIWILFNCF